MVKYHEQSKLSITNSYVKLNYATLLDLDAIKYGPILNMGWNYPSVNPQQVGNIMAFK